MCELFELRFIDCVFEVGIGLGYHVVVFVLLVGYVWSIEMHVELLWDVIMVLECVGIVNVMVIVGDGFVGLLVEVLFDAISVMVVVLL